MKKEETGGPEIESKAELGEVKTPARSRRFLDRRKFLSRSGAMAGGATLAYASPSIRAVAATGQALSPSDPLLLCNSDLSSFPFSSTAQSELAIVTPIANKFQSQGSASLTPTDLNDLWAHGWRPAAEVNSNASVRECLNTGLGFAPGPWAAQIGNQNQYFQPSYDVTHQRLNDISSNHNVRAFAGIIIVIIVIVAVVDFPSPAN